MPTKALPLLWVILVASCTSLRAQTPTAPLLPIQGRLTVGNGVPIPDGARVMQFKIYDAPVGGQAVWSGEVQKLTVNAGLINTLLGTKMDLSKVDFDRTLYLEITVDANADDQITPADPPLLPRQVILPAVFAKESADSRKLAGYDWGALLNIKDPVNGRLVGSKIADNTLPGNALLDETITSNKIAVGQIDSRALSPNSIVAEKIVEGQILLTKLAKEVRDTLVPAGTVVAFAGSSDRVPDGWYLCDGRPLSRAENSALFAAIREAWGGGDGNSTFNLPDLRGVFLRGVNGSRSDVYADPGDNRTRDNMVGSFQTDSFQSHDHRVYGPAPGGSGVNTTRFSLNAIDYVVINQPFTRANAGAELYAAEELPPARASSETRPKNASVNYIIKR